MITLMIPGKPLGKQRPRMTRGGHVYTPQQTVNYEVQIKEAFRAEYPDFVPMDKALRMSVIASFPIPRSWPMWKQELAMTSTIRMTQMPDGDNILKVTKDALNKMAYKDDSQVYTATITKLYGRIPRLLIQICEDGLPSQLKKKPDCGTEGQDE